MDEQEKLKQIPIIVMLFAAAVTAIISLFSEITFGMFLLRIFLASIIFYIIGTIAQILFTYGLKKEEEKSGEENDSEETSEDRDEDGDSDEEEDDEY